MSVELENKMVLGAIFAGSLIAGCSVMVGYYAYTFILLI